MDPTLNWDFTLANYGPVWSFLVQLGLLLLFLMLGNILRRTIPFFRKCLIPSALLGGTLLLIVGTWYNRQLEKVRRARPPVDAAGTLTPPSAAPLRVLFVGAPELADEAADLLRTRVGEGIDVRTSPVPEDGLLFHADRVIGLGDVVVEPVPGMRGTLQHWDAGHLDARVEGLAALLVGEG